MHRKSMTKRTNLIRGIAALFVGGAILAPGIAPEATAATLYWDANDVAAGRTDGAGGWFDTDHWWTGSANTSWADGSDAVFGYSGAGGAVTLAGTATVNSFAFNPFTGTYTLGTTGALNTITLNSGITHSSGGTASIISPLLLGGAQTWTNNSGLNITGTSAAGSLKVGGATDGINNNGHTLTFAGIGTTELLGAISGGGGLTKNGTGVLIIRAAPTQAYTGDTTINGGIVRISGADSFGTGTSITINDGIIEGYFGGTFNRALGTAANQIQILGGTSGFSGQGGTGTTFQIGGGGSTITWGSSFFNPSVFVLGAFSTNANGKMTLNNALNLGGVTRTIASFSPNDTAATSGSAISGAVTNGGLTKIGVGNLILTNAGNNYAGPTNINGGTITLSGSGAITATSALNLGGGNLRLVNTANTQRFADVAVTATAGGGVTYDNSANAVNYTESLGSLTLTKGQFNVLLNNDHNAAAGSQTLTFGTAGTGNLTQGVSGKGSITFSAPTTGLNGTKNIVAVFGASETPAGGIIGPWATTGTAANVQTGFAAYDASGFVVAAAPTVAAVDTDLSSSSGNYDINTGSLFTLAATRTVNAVQFRGAASTLDLATNRLETNGFFFSGGAGNAKTISGTGAAALTTPSGGGNLYITTGQVMTAGNEHRIGVPITNNSGTVHLVKSGAGVLRLNGANTFTGDIDINAGTLQIGTNATANGANLGGGTYAGNIFIAAGANLDYQSNATQTLSGVISGDGNLLQRYNGTLTLGDDNTYTGKTTIGAITNAGNPTLVVSSFNSYNGGTPLLANSSLGAPTTLANATIQMGSTNSSPNPTIRYVGTGETTDRIINFTFNSGANRTLDASNASGLLKFTSPFTANDLNTGVIALTGTGAGEIASLPFLFGNLTKSGNGTWTLAGPSGSVGSVSVSAGTLIATDPRALGAAIGSGVTTGPTIAGSGTLSLRNNNSVTFGVAGTGYNINNSAGGATINVDRVSGTGSNILTVGNLTTTSTAGGWQLNFTGANGVSLNAGALTAPLSSAATTHIISNNIATTNNASLTLASISMPSTNAAPVLNFTGTGTTNVTGAITQTTAALALTKTGAGTVVLNGGASYTGTTTVSNGTLRINGTHTGMGAVTVENTATLGGSGTIGGAVTVESGGFLAPGNSAGSQSYNAGLTFDSGANYNWEHTAGNALGSGGSDFDVANITGGTLVNSGGNLNLNFAAGTDFSTGFWDGSPTWNIVTGGSSGATPFGTSNIFVNINGAPVDGGDNAISGQGSFSTAIVGNDLQLQWTASLGGNPTLSVAPGTVNFGGLLQNAALPSGSLVTISNSGATSSGSSVAITGSNPTKFAASNLSPANIPGGGSSTSTIELAAGATATNGTFTADVEYSAPSMTNVLADSTVGASVIVGNASFHGSLNTSTNFGPALVTTVNAGQVLTDVNLASNTDNATVIGGGPARVGTTATIVSYDNTLGGVETVGMAWRSRTAAEADLLNNPKALLSDVVRITGMGASETDVGTFLLTMTYDLDLPEFASLNEMAIANSGELQLAWYDPDLNEWVNAIDGNIGGSPDFVGISAPTGGLGSWGIHVDGNGGAGNGKGYVWAYLNHNSDFAVIPEPSTLVFGALALLGFAGAGLRRRRLAKAQA